MPSDSEGRRSKVASIEMNGDNLKISIQGQSDHFFVQDLYIKAVVHLIEEADTGGWEKHNIEHGKNPDTEGAFCSAVLSAVARHYIASGLNPELEGKTAYEVLPTIIKYLYDGGHLTDIMGGGGDPDVETETTQ
jgi:hypothetical protein